MDLIRHVVCLKCDVRRVDEVRVCGTKIVCGTEDSFFITQFVLGYRGPKA
jgi:hypothetical protein